MEKDPAAMVDEELSNELKKAAKELDAWRERALPATKEELEEHFVIFMRYHRLAKEEFARREFKNTGRKLPWN